MLSNKEKQERFRRLKELKKYAQDICSQASVKSSFANLINHRTINSDNLTTYFKTGEIIKNLPRNWNNDDYNVAYNKLKLIEQKLYENPTLLYDDISEIYNTKLDTNNDETATKNIEKDIYEKATLITKNIKSTLSLMNFSPAVQGAILMEVIRMVGHELINENNIIPTFSNAFVLSSISKEYKKPEWVKAKREEYFNL